MKPPGALALKDLAVEEWTDVHFFRPLGIRVARALEPTRVTADQVTLAGLVVGLAAGHLMVYAGVWVNLLGVALLVVSDVFDSADGQLSRLRGTSTRLGRVLDGISDMVRFLNLYAHLYVRLLRAEDWGWPGLVLMAAVIWSHSWQGAAVDFIKNAYVEVGAGRDGAADLPEDLEPERDASRMPRVARRMYAAYVRRQARMFPVTCRLLRSLRRSGGDPAFAARYAGRQAGLLPVLALIATNIRFALLAAAVAVHHMAWFLYATAVPMNLVMLAVMVVHERNTGVLVRQAAAHDAERAVAS